MPPKFSEPIFLHDVPACVYSDSLVIADTHIGLETEILGKGSAPVFLRKNAEEITRLARENNCKKIILLGDVKHKITAEDDYVFEFFKMLEDFEITIVPGNHDGSLKKYAMFHANVKFAEQPGMVYNRAAFAHGHAWPEPEMLAQDYLFVGHAHPAIEFKDKFEHKSVQKAWIIGGLDEKSEMLKKKFPDANLGIKVIFVPAFNPLISGSAINSEAGTKALGPLLKNKLFKVDEAKIYLLNGVNLGSAKNYTKTKIKTENNDKE